MIDRSRFHPSRLVFGICLILVGALSLAGKLDLLDSRLVWRLWPLLLLGLGTVKLLFPRERGERWGGAWLLVVGGWALCSTFGWLGLSWHNSWPILLIGVGGLMALRAVFDRDGQQPGADYERSRDAENRAFAAERQAGDAERRILEARLDPHTHLQGDDHGR